MGDVWRVGITTSTARPASRFETREARRETNQPSIGLTTDGLAEVFSRPGSRRSSLDAGLGVDVAVPTGQRQTRSRQSEISDLIDVALDAGFGDLSNFNHAFRAEFG